MNRLSNSFQLDCRAQSIIEPTSVEEIIYFLKNRENYPTPILVVGGCNNLLFKSDFSGTILRPSNKKIELLYTDNEAFYIAATSGVEWDNFVLWCMNNGYYGIENLSGIPGKVGSTPIQNIGAYGLEIGNFIYEVKTIMVADATICKFTKEECNFGYRDSIFKKSQKNRHVVTDVIFRIPRHYQPILTYDKLQEITVGSNDETARKIRQTVLELRNTKLPDPAKIGNAGSFFKNPIIEVFLLQQLLKRFPTMPHNYISNGYYKLSAAWLIDKAGWKGYRCRDFGVCATQPLILVNYGKATGEEIVALSEEIRNSVKTIFGIRLDNEVEVIE